MGKINDLIIFEPKKKAVAAHVNSNFEKLRLANNENAQLLDELSQTVEANALNKFALINCNSDFLELNTQTTMFKVSGTSTIQSITGVESGFVFIEFLSSRLLVNNNNLRLQSGVDKITNAGDVGIYAFENGRAKEINYFAGKELHTNSFIPQAILNCPKNCNGRADFIETVKFSGNIIPLMEAFENEHCIVSASSQYDAVSYMPWKLFRGHTNDAQGWLTVTGVSTGWCKIEFKHTSPKVTAFSITSRNSTDANTYSPCDFLLEGSNDDVNWTLLGDYSENLNWLQKEKRYFALTFSAEFKYYRITVSKISGAGTYCGFGALEFYETLNDFMPMTARFNLSSENPLLINTGIGMFTGGKFNQMSLIGTSHQFENLLNNSLMYAGFKKGEDGRFIPFATPAQPVYSHKLQRHSDKSSFPTMISATTSIEFNSGYSVTASSFFAGTGGPFPPQNALNGNLTNKWQASVAGGNQWLQMNYPNYRKAARIAIVASEVPGGCIKNGFIKGYDGEEWLVLKEISGQTGWTAQQIRFFDLDLIKNCSKFKIEITDIETATASAQIAQIYIYEVADCFVIPENKFFSYNIKTCEFEEQEMIYVGRLKTSNNFVTEANSYAVENRYISNPVTVTANTTYSFFHNLGLDYKNIKMSAWIKDNINGFIVPWFPDCNVDSSYDRNNYGFFVDDCEFRVRIPVGPMSYKDYNGTNRVITTNASLMIQLERNF